MAYFLPVHGRSLSVSDRYWIADSEGANFTGSVRSNFGWIVQPLVCIHQMNGVNSHIIIIMPPEVPQVRLGSQSSIRETRGTVKVDIVAVTK